MVNSRDISLLRPDVEANCRKWLERCKEAGLNVLITNTVRDKEYQEYLYAQGRTRPGSIVTNGKTPTFHADTAGLAFDFCKNVKGHEYDDAEFFRKAAAIAKEMGFSWGGDWKSFPDKPHIQWDNGGEWTSSMIKAGKLPPVMPLCGTENTAATEKPSEKVPEVKVDPAKSKNSAYNKTYAVTASALNMRSGASTGKAVLTVLPKGTKFRCYGYFTKAADGTIWLYGVANGKTGFCSAAYLK